MLDPELGSSIDIKLVPNTADENIGSTDYLVQIIHFCFALFLCSYHYVSHARQPCWSLRLRRLTFLFLKGISIIFPKLVLENYKNVNRKKTRNQPCSVAVKNICCCFDLFLWHSTADWKGGTWKNGTWGVFKGIAALNDRISMNPSGLLFSRRSGWRSFTHPLWDGSRSCCWRK